MNIHSLYSIALNDFPWTRDVRRSLHRIPETGFQEFKTQAFITKTLSELGIPFTTERTWVIAEIAGGKAGPTVALRADMDALPIVEPQGCPFRSEHEGWMHACGHDVHTAVQLGAAKLLMFLRDEMPGTVRLLFQPAEETLGGAVPMVKAGAMQGVDAVYGLHVQPYMKAGTIDSRYGCLNASTDEIDITVRGISAHAARPHQGVDAIVVAAQLITALQTVVARNVSPTESAALSFGLINGGEARNVICDHVQLTGTLRTADPVLREQLKARVREICLGVGAAMGAQIDVNIITGYDALINHDAEVDRVFRLGRALLGEEHVELRREPSMGGEDFSYFLEEAPGAFWHLGCSKELPAPSLHSKDLVIDEDCIPIGVAMECGLALDFMCALED